MKKNIYPKKYENIIIIDVEKTRTATIALLLAGIIVGSFVLVSMVNKRNDYAKVDSTTNVIITE